MAFDRKFLDRPEARVLVTITGFAALMCLYAVFMLLIGIQQRLDVLVNTVQ